MPFNAQPAASTTETVDDMVAKLRRGYRNTGFRNQSGVVQLGLFGNLVGAEVAVEQRIEVGRNGEFTSVRHTLVAACAGFGCTDPLSEVSTRDLIFDCDHGDITEEGRLAARKRAQAHAETCRALPRPTA